ncbi:AMP-binding protein [Streptomyces sp. SID5926]|nr:AMP-binding protein [Streptomyces sp. SID5926]
MTPEPRTAGEPPDASARRTLPRLLARNARDYPRLPGLSWQPPEGDGNGDWTTLTWAEIHEHTERLAAGYAGLGVGRGDHVLMMMANRPEHWLSDLALVRLGAVPVSVYATAAPEQITHIARNCRARVAVVEGADQARLWEPLLTDADTPLERLVVAEPGAEGGHVPYADLLREPAPERFAKELDAANPEDPLTVVYTSGTTGEPKGVVLTHRQVLANALALDAVVELPPHVEHICYLPFAHIAERMLGIYLPCHRASHVYLCADPAAVGTIVRKVRPAQFFGVPRIWEKLCAAVRAVLSLMPAEQREVIDAASAVAREHVGYRERGESPPAELEERYARAREEVLLPLLAGAGDMLSGLGRTTIWNQTIPDRLRGRLAGIEVLSYSIGPQLGQVRAGAMAGWTGARPAIWTGGVACVAAVGLLTAALPRLVGYDARTDEDALRRAREGDGPRAEEPTPT